MKNLKKIIKTTINEVFNEKNDLSNYDFNIGDCDIYAISLHRLYNYQLYAMRGKFLEPEWGGKREWDYEYCHIMVKLPNGNYMDSDGEQTKQEMISSAVFSEDVRKIEIVKITEKEAINMFSCDDKEKNIQNVMNYIKNNIETN